MNALPTMAFSEQMRPVLPRDLPVAPIVYHIWKKDSLLYVGSTIDPRQRLRDHRLMNFRWLNGATHLTWRIVGLKRLYAEEMSDIQKMNPIHNRFRPRNVRVD